MKHGNKAMGEIAQEIEELKKEKNAVILAHNYQRGEVQDIADYLGDSLGLSRKASEFDCDVIVFCGVRFMAESAKILSPEREVLLPREEAGCPMADMVTVDELISVKAKHPDAEVVCYVNTNADVKAESDVCCTSANAVEVVKNMDAERIIFVPDKNLASFVQRFTQKEIIAWSGYCYVHSQIEAEDVRKARELHRKAAVIVHPECNGQVIDLADEVLSTGGMMRFARESNVQEIIVGTEAGLLYRLRKENPVKTFYGVGPGQICKNMKMTTLEDVRAALKEEKYEVQLPDDIMKRARKALNRMLQYA
jgi:quinolinate synthase